MASDGTEYAADDHLDEDNDKLNRKTVLVGKGVQLVNTYDTFPGQEAFCTDSSDGFTSDNLYARDAADTVWTTIKASHAEQSNTPITDTLGTAGFRTTKFYHFVTLPTTEQYYIIHKIEWKNGATVIGNVMAGVEIVDANPPTVNSSILMGLTHEVAQSGTNSIQSANLISKPFPAGSTVGIFVWCSDSTGTLRYVDSQPGQLQTKPTGFNINPAVHNTTAWNTSTNRLYMKIYYKGYP